MVKKGGGRAVVGFGRTVGDTRLVGG